MAARKKTTARKAASHKATRSKATRGKKKRRTVRDRRESSGKARSFEDCRIRPGQVLNPKGNNQYTYRRDAEQTFERILKSAASDGKGTVAEEIIDVVVRMAQNQDRWALDRVLERMLPKVEKIELKDEADAEALAAEFAGMLR